jgi:hypothetical protein
MIGIPTANHQPGFRQAKNENPIAPAMSPATSVRGSPKRFDQRTDPPLHDRERDADPVSANPPYPPSSIRTVAGIEHEHGRERLVRRLYRKWMVAKPINCGCERSSRKAPSGLARIHENAARRSARSDSGRMNKPYSPFVRLNPAETQKGTRLTELSKPPIAGPMMKPRPKLPPSIQTIVRVCQEA